MTRLPGSHFGLKCTIWWHNTSRTLWIYFYTMTSGNPAYRRLRPVSCVHTFSGTQTPPAWSTPHRPPTRSDPCFVSAAEKRVYLKVIFKGKCLNILHAGPEGSLRRLLIIVRLNVTLITGRMDQNFSCESDFK